MKTHGNFAAYTSCKEQNIKFLSKKTLNWYLENLEWVEEITSGAYREYYIQQYEVPNFHLI